jgi:hypothetical protein
MLWNTPSPHQTTYFQVKSFMNAYLISVTNTLITSLVKLFEMGLNATPFTLLAEYVLRNLLQRILWERLVNVKIVQKEPRSI